MWIAYHFCVAFAFAASYPFSKSCGVPRDATHALISAAIDIVVHLERLPSGRRVVSDVHEVRDEHGLCVTSALYGRGGLAEDLS